jgi:hypothetical protein
MRRENHRLVLIDDQFLTHHALNCAAPTGSGGRCLPRAADPVWIKRERHPIAHLHAPYLRGDFNDLAGTIRTGNQLG